VVSHVALLICGNKLAQNGHYRHCIHDHAVKGPRPIKSRGLLSCSRMLRSNPCARGRCWYHRTQERSFQNERSLYASATQVFLFADARVGAESIHAPATTTGGSDRRHRVQRQPLRWSSSCRSCLATRCRTRRINSASIAARGIYRNVAVCGPRPFRRCSLGTSRTDYHHVPPAIFRAA